MPRLTKADRSNAIARIKELQVGLKSEAVIKDIVTGEFHLSPDQYRDLYQEALDEWAAEPASNAKARWTSVLTNIAGQAVDKGQLSAAVRAVAEIVKIQGLDKPDATKTEADEIEAARLADLLSKYPPKS